MDGRRLFRSLRLRNFLSFGQAEVQLELEPLNILIGQNASGKSNLVQAVELLRATATNLTTPIVQGGGVEEWLYKGGTRGENAWLMAEVDYPPADDVLGHTLSFTSVGQRLSVIYEQISSLVKMNAPKERLDLPDLYYDYHNGSPIIAKQKAELYNGFIVVSGWEESRLSGIKADLSILSQRYEPDAYPSLAYLSELYRSIKVYRNLNFDGPNSMRRAQQPDLPTDFLEEDGRNLGLVLNDLQHRGILRTIIEKMQAVYEDVTDITIKLGGGAVQIFMHERGMNSPIPASRLSDGTLRYLCLLAILYHPAPPLLICLEDPEIGLHPDLISGLAEMLKEASQRTQLIVTTHSDLLVSKFTDQPEAVVVCERTPGGTTLERLNAQKLESWLDEYSLGEVWLRGGIGGTRW